MPLPLVSIVIPFYNEEIFLERAINSALRQTYSAVEIILVNDGSIDNSPAIAKEFERKFTNIKFIDAAHHSLGHARNIGIAKATGKYITFLDSDDELENLAVEKLVQKIEQDESDIVVAKFNSYNASGELMSVDGWNLNGEPIDNFKAACGMYEHTIASTAWAKLYRLATVQKIKFPEGLWFEDRPFLLNYFLNVRKVSFEDIGLWNIHSRPSSITRRIIEVKRIEDTCRIFVLELSIIEGNQYQKRLEVILFRHHIRALMSTLIILCSDKNVVYNLSELEKTFDYWVKDFTNRLKRSKCAIGRRAWLDLFYIRLYQLIGWRLIYIILPYLKYKKYKTIFKIRAT
jgi:glycosyltransferase involved in cell wall biosynthesis